MTPDRVAFTFAGQSLVGDVVDVLPRAEYGRGPYDLLLVDVPGAGQYRVHERDANPI